MSWVEQGRRALKKWSDARMQRRFNCGDQGGAAWLDRAEIAVDMLAGLVGDAGGHAGAARIADIGAGDGKFRRMLEARLPGARYQGYDIAPQSAETRRFDLDRDVLEAPVDVAVLLGVLEYSADLDRALARLRPMCGALIVSHAVSDRRHNPKGLARKLNWTTHLSEAAFSERLASAGFDARDRRVTTNGRSVLWACR